MFKSITFSLLTFIITPILFLFLYFRFAIDIVKAVLSQQKTQLQGLPKKTILKMKLILFVRGVTANNLLFTDKMQQLHDELLEAARKNLAPAKDLEIPRIDYTKIDPLEFYKDYALNPRPVILTNFQSNVSDWDLSTLASRFGNAEVVATGNENGRDHKIKFSEWYQSEWKDSSYIHNCESIWSEDKNLINDLNLWDLGRLVKNKLGCAQMFLGNVKTGGTDFHCANNLNFFFQVKGAKKWTFVDPRNTYMMYPVVSKTNSYFYSLAGMPRNYEKVKDQLPLFEYCPRFSAVIESGEVLFNPCWWWHAVEPVSDETISVATRWGAMSLSTLIGNKYLSDHRESNLLFTSLQLLSPYLFKHYFKYVYSELNQPVSYGQSFCTSKGEPIFQEASHDGIQEETKAGNLTKSWRPAKADKNA